MKNQNKNIYAILVFAAVLTVTVIIVQAIDFGFDALKAKLKIFNNSSVSTPEGTKLPSNELPPTGSDISIVSEIGLKRLVLNATPYTPSNNVLNDKDIYNSESIRLLLNGDFDRVQLHITGKVTEYGKHFLNLVYGNAGGTLNGVRLSENTLNTNLTQERGGVFTSEKPIDLKINLLVPVQLSTTKDEFEKNQQTFKLVDLWQSNLLPPTYISFLLAPFNESGVFGGAEIISTLEYSCREGKSCQASVCPQGKMITECMKIDFGVEAAKDWCKRAGYPKCDF